MQYDFKFVWEVGRAVIFAIAVYAATTLAGFTAVEDWETYLVAVGVGMANVVGTAVLAAISKGGPLEPL